MDVIRLLHGWSNEALGRIHARRREVIWVGVRALLRGQRLWLTALGRHVGGAVSEKHAIKRMDRLLGNRHVHLERRQWYGWLARRLLGSVTHPVILVDWSDLDERSEVKVLRAALAVGGRALPLYEEVHAHEGDWRMHRAFLHQLREIVGPDRQPVLVTDAWFRAWWFELVEQMGWLYVGRVRNRELVCEVGGENWRSNKVLHADATTRPRSLGEMMLAKSHRLVTRLYLYRARPKGRIKHNRAGCESRSQSSRKHARREREPWLLASNLPHGLRAARRVVKLYRTRMQIEEGFRDLKAPRNGFAMRENLGRDPRRVAVLLLLAALAMLATWLTGLHGYARRMHRQLQANTVTSRRVLSVFFVGRRLLERNVAIAEHEFEHALRLLHLSTLQPWAET